MTNNKNINNAGKTIIIPAFSDRARKLTVLGIGIFSVIMVLSLIFAPFYTTTFFDEFGDKEHSTVRAVDILRTRDMLNKILAENTGKPIEEIERDTERDNFMTAEQALAYGLIDRVVSRRA